MSMTVDNVSYLTGMRQNMRVSTGEKQEEKGGDAADVGKTQQSAGSAALDQVNMGQDGIAVTEVSRQQGTEQSAAQKQPAVPRMDTVEISAEGRAASPSFRDSGLKPTLDRQRWSSMRRRICLSTPTLS